MIFEFILDCDLLILYTRVPCRLAGAALARARWRCSSASSWSSRSSWTARRGTWWRTARCARPPPTVPGRPATGSTGTRRSCCRRLGWSWPLSTARTSSRLRATPPAVPCVYMGGRRKDDTSAGEQGAQFNWGKNHHENHHEKTSHQKVTIKKSNLTFVMIFVMFF